MNQTNALPKVLLCCPVNAVKEYCFWDWLNMARNLSYKNYDIYLSDNSRSKDFCNRIREIGVECSWVNPIGKENIMYMAESHELCRQKAIRDKYDYIFHLECDVFPPCEDIIERLLLTHKRVVSATYHIKDGDKSQLCIGVVQDTGHPHFASTYLMKDGSDMNFIDGSVKESYSAGIGCTLIHRSVFEQVKFRAEKGGKMHPDSYFYMDLFGKRIKSYIDTSLHCNHKNSQWLHY